MPLTLPRRGARECRQDHEGPDRTRLGRRQVKLTLMATDDAGHTATSETKTMMMPERPFSNPLARAVVEQRRILALDANGKRARARPDGCHHAAARRHVRQYGALPGHHERRTRLKMADTDDELRDVVSYLWEIALGIEEGDLSAAEKRLRQAQQAFQQALKNGASDEEIDKLMKELREAMNEFLHEFAERAQQNPNMAADAAEDRSCARAICSA